MQVNGYEIKPCADLRGADLREADLREADLRGANLWNANLIGADLMGADLWGANLRSANLGDADIGDADLIGANLWGADLRGANFIGADLWGADLRHANLMGAKIEFRRFPNLSFFTCFNLGQLPEDLTLELMRRDADAHPYPERFDVWAAGGECPYKNEDRYFLFEISRELWKPGPPEMRTSDLIKRLCEHFKWEIENY